jgi:asperthecin polyketide synthase
MSTVKDTASGGPSAAVTAIDAGKLVFFGNEFPNDDLKDLFRRLYRQSKDRRFRQLSAFLEEVTSVLKKEVSLLPQPMREVVPHFDSVCHLIEHGDFRNTPLGAAMESVFLTTLQLGMFIGYVSRCIIAFDLYAGAHNTIVTTRPKVWPGRQYSLASFLLV